MDASNLGTAQIQGDAIWLLGYLRSLSLLPSVVGPEQTTLRNGLLQTATFATADVSGLRAYEAAARSEPGYLDLTPPLTEPTHLLELARPVAVRGPFGKRRSASIIGIALDDPDGFFKALDR